MKRQKRLERLARWRRAERDRAQRARESSRRSLDALRQAGQVERQAQHGERQRFAIETRRGTPADWWRTAADGLAWRSERIRRGRAEQERAERADAEALRQLREAQSRSAAMERAVERERQLHRRELDRRAQRELDERGSGNWVRRVLGLAWLAAALLWSPPSGGEALLPREADDAGLVRLLEDIRARQLKLEQRELEVADRERHAEELEKLVAAKLSELEEIAAGVERRIAAWEDAHEAKSISKLAKIYAEMEPPRAAQLLSDLDLELATRIVAKMKPKESAALLPLLPESRALTMSRKVAHPLSANSAGGSR